MIEAVATALNPWGTILAFIGALTGVLIYLRRWLKKILGEAKDAADRNEHAARQQTAASRETSDAVGVLVEKLTESEAARARENAARTREADRNDKTFTAFLESLAASRDQARWIQEQNIPSRVRQLEEFAADRETEEHITGRLRLHEVAPLTHEQDHT
jgi:hypothetical protein